VFSRRELLQVAAATAVLVPPGWTRAVALQRLTDDLFGFDAIGNVTLLHYADLHAQLLPVYFREPSVNLAPERRAAWSRTSPAATSSPASTSGEEVYMAKCAACHGEFGESAGRWPQVAGGQGSLASHDPVKTVGSYFAHLSTVFDYVRHAMPVRRRAVADQRRALCRHRLHAVPQRYRGRRIRAVARLSGA